MDKTSGSDTGSTVNAERTVVDSGLSFMQPDFRYEGQHPASFMHRVSAAIMEVVENELLLALSQQSQGEVLRR